MAAAGFDSTWPYSHITPAIVVWNDPDRLWKLLKRIRPFFETIAVNVQCDNPRDPGDDDTFAAAEEIADILVTSRVAGFGDATFGPDLLPRIKTKWT